MMTVEELHEKVYHKVDVIRDTVTRIINEEPKGIAVENITQMIMQIQSDMYHRGQLGIQQEMIKLLDLRHLLGLHGR